MKHYVDWFGDDNLLFSTDYPHGDAMYPNAVKNLKELPLSEESLCRIVGDNWSRLYDIPLVRRRAGRG